MKLYCWILLPIIILILVFFIFHRTDLEYLDDNVDKLRKIQSHLQQISADNPCDDVYCRFWGYDKVLSVSIYDTLLQKSISFKHTEYETHYKDSVRIESFNELVSLCIDLYEGCEANNFEFISYNTKYYLDQKTKKPIKKAYPTITENLTPDDMFNVTITSKYVANVFKFNSARTFVEQHRKDLNCRNFREQEEHLFEYDASYYTLSKDNYGEK